jgi:carbon monoxide dehydrogenase subunit G
LEFSNEFDVDAPVADVYEALLDVERVAPCVPGAQVLETTGADSYKVAIKVKLGPVTMQYRGDVEVVDKDEAARTAAMHVRAKETRGQGTAEATSRIALEDRGETTHATITTDVKLSGKAAAMGGRMVGDVSAKMVDTFARNLAAMLGDGDAEEAPAPEAPPGPETPRFQVPPPAEAELDALDLAGSVIAGRLQRPRALATALGVVFLLGFAAGRRRR